VLVGFHNLEGGAISLPQIREAFLAGVNYVNEELGGINGRPMKADTCNLDVTPESSVELPTAWDSTLEAVIVREMARARTEGRDDRVRFPMTARRVIRDAIAAEAPRIAAQQIRGDARFINEDVLPGIMERLRGHPLPPCGGHIRTPLFRGVDGFF